MIARKISSIELTGKFDFGNRTVSTDQIRKVIFPSSVGGGMTLMLKGDNSIMRSDLLNSEHVPVARIDEACKKLFNCGYSELTADGRFGAIEFVKPKAPVTASNKNLFLSKGTVARWYSAMLCMKALSKGKIEVAKRTCGFKAKTPKKVASVVDTSGSNPFADSNYRAQHSAQFSGGKLKVKELSR